MLKLVTVVWSQSYSDSDVQGRGCSNVRALVALRVW
jgi:hypothetical protein